MADKRKVNRALRKLKKAKTPAESLAILAALDPETKKAVKDAK